MNKQVNFFLFHILVGAFLLFSPAKANNNNGIISSEYQDATLQRKFDYFYYEGLKLKLAGAFDSAFEMFNHCLSIDPTASPVLYELASFYLQLGQPEKAVEMLKNAVKNDPDNYNYRMGLASISRSLGLFGEAVEEYAILTKQYPAKTELNFYLAEALTQKGDLQEAIKAYDDLELAIGMNEGLSMQKFKLYNELGEKEKAYNEINKLADKYPMEARFSILLGDLYLENKELEKALEYYQKAHKIDPSNPYYIVSMSRYYEAKGDYATSEKQIKEALINEHLDVETKVSILAQYLVRLKQSQQGIESANALFDELTELHPEDIDLKIMYGSLLVQQQKNEEATFQFQLVTEMEPTNQGAWQQLLSIALQAENFDEAIRLCQKCMELFPESPEYYFYLGITYTQQKNNQEALNTYIKGIDIIPEGNRPLKSDFYGQIGDIYSQMEQMDQAFEAYENGLTYNPQNIVILNNYSYFLSLAKKELKKAERMSAQTIKVEPDNATYLDTYAWILFVQGDYSLAKIYIEKALQQDKTNSHELIDHYGDILYMLGNKEKALEQWKKAKELGKESEVLERKIAEEIYIEE